MDSPTAHCLSILDHLYNGHGRVGDYPKIIRDITERHRSAELLQSVLDHSLDGIISIDERGTISLFNQAAERIFRYPASEVLGQNVRMLMPDDTTANTTRYLDNFLRTGEAKIHRSAGRSKGGERTARRSRSTWP